jgi:putative (di)nucleoside polyphosphate hydrolase
VLLNAAGLVLVARRADMPNAEGAPGGWRVPQGGIDETRGPARRPCCASWPRRSAPTSAEIIGEHPEWLTYDLPAHLIGSGAGRGGIRGQRQRWFALRFAGVDADIRLDADPHPEFVALALGGAGRAAGAGARTSSATSTGCWRAASRGSPAGA